MMGTWAREWQQRWNNGQIRSVFVGRNDQLIWDWVLGMKEEDSLISDLSNEVQYSAIFH